MTLNLAKLLVYLQLYDHLTFVFLTLLDVFNHVIRIQ